MSYMCLCHICGIYITSIWHIYDMYMIYICHMYVIYMSYMCHIYDTYTHCCCIYMPLYSVISSDDIIIISYLMVKKHIWHNRTTYCSRYCSRLKMNSPSKTRMRCHTWDFSTLSYYRLDLFQMNSSLKTYDSIIACDPQTMKTKTIPDNNNPKWNETLTLNYRYVL